MRKRKSPVRRFINGILLCTFLIITVTCKSYAADVPSIEFQGNHNRFVFSNIKGTDLFPAFKGLMPGDSVEQSMMLSVKNISGDTKIFFRAECEPEVQELLEDVTMDIYLDGNKSVSGQLIFDNIVLGSYTKSQTQDMKAVLHIPTSLGNEIAEQEAHIKWIFTAQQAEETVSAVAKTGDTLNGNVMLLLTVIGLSAVIIIGKLLSIKRHG